MKVLNLAMLACAVVLTQACDDSPKTPSAQKPNDSGSGEVSPLPAPSDPSELVMPSEDSAQQVEPANCATYPRNPCHKDMVFVECGTFTMGAITGRDEIKNKKGIALTELDESGEFFRWEVPSHTVGLSNFCISRHEVTQKEWEEIIGTDLEEHALTRTTRALQRIRGDYPMYYVNWYEANEYASEFGKKIGKKCRLPTEAEWEYAARGGKNSKGYNYSGSNNVASVAWHDVNSNGLAQVPCQKSKNELDLCDMSGNMFEWVNDWYVRYSPEDQVNPKGPSQGTSKVLRGGGWHNFEYFGRAAFRGSYAPGSSDDYIGFRVACEI